MRRTSQIRRDSRCFRAWSSRKPSSVMEPVSVREVAREAFELDFTNDPGTPPSRFDMRSRHAALFGGRDGYLYDRRMVLEELRAFVRRDRASGVTK